MYSTVLLQQTPLLLYRSLSSPQWYCIISIWNIMMFFSLNALPANQNE